MTRNSRTVRGIWAALAVMAAIAACVGQAAADEADGGTPAGSTSLVSVTSDVGPSDAPCASGLAARLALTRDVITTADRFTIVIHVGRPLCTPISAKAAVYAMPGGANAWPQTLVEAVPLELQQMGTVTVSFDKPCRDLQFDIIEGDTPKEISPIGQWHGPLLFAGDTSTTLQWFGTGSVRCGEVPPPPPPTVTTTVTITPHSGGDDTTTTSTTSTSTTSTSTTTSSTTVPVTSTTDPSAVSGSSDAVAASASVASGSAAKLAFTG